MSAEEQARSLGIEFPKKEKGYLSLCIRTGNLLITSGHVSDIIGKLDFTDQHLVINGCSDLLHEVFGRETDGYHARSALGFAALPTGAAVEVEAIFEIYQQKKN